MVGARAGINGTTSNPTLYIFGDSLSDIGGMKNKTFGIIPPWPFWQGRFSSGPLWNEYLAKLLGYNLINKAVGGSTSDVSSSSLTVYSIINLPIYVPSTMDQINEFKSSSPMYKASCVTDDDIVILAVGADDFLAEMVNLSTNKLTVENFSETLSNNIVYQLEQLRSIGFKRIVVANMAAIHYTPYADILGMKDVANVTINYYNKQLAIKANSWASSAPGLSLFAIADIAGFIETTLNSSDIINSLGITNADSACLGGNTLKLVNSKNRMWMFISMLFNVSETLMCSSPENSYFFDVLHPGEKITRLFGYYSNALIKFANIGKQLPPTKANLLAIINKYNLGSTVVKPVQIMRYDPLALNLE
ncbi:hypothetical protein GGF37_000933 [Kickxella alabastrina]|nr:hypothetical protein GGF37_000933 [Kickxella alabastrina]